MEGNNVDVYLDFSKVFGIVSLLFMSENENLKKKEILFGYFVRTMKVKIIKFILKHRIYPPVFRGNQYRDLFVVFNIRKEFT